MKTRRFHRAFTITEMLLIIGILGVAALISSRLFRASILIAGATPAAQDRLVILDRMGQTLGQDVWNARQIDVKDAHHVQLTQSDNAVIQWEFGPDQVRRSSDKGAALRRWNVRSSIEARKDDVSLLLSVRADPAHGPDQRRFVSQLLAAREMHP